MTELIIFHVFKKAVEDKAYDYGYDFKTTEWYSLEVILLILIIIISALVLIKVLELDRSILTFGPTTDSDMSATSPSVCVVT